MKITFADQKKETTFGELEVGAVFARADGHIFRKIGAVNSISMMEDTHVTAFLDAAIITEYDAELFLTEKKG